MKDQPATMKHQPGISRLLLVAVTLLLTMLAAPGAGFVSAQATPATVNDAIVITGKVKSPGPLTIADLRALPSETLDVTFTAAGKPQSHTFVGTPLLGVLERVGLDVPARTKNPLLGLSFVVTAKDGYQVVISGGELDPAFGNTRMYIAWEQDGAALTGKDGPVRLVVPGDTKGGRYVSGVVSIEVRSVKDEAATPAG